MYETLERLLNDYDANRQAILQQIIENLKISDFDINHYYDGWALIHYAVYYRDEDLILYLSKNKANMRLITDDGEIRNVYHLLLAKDNCPVRIFSLVDHLLSEDGESDDLIEGEDAGNDIAFVYLAKNSHPELYTSACLFLHKYADDSPFDESHRGVSLFHGKTLISRLTCSARATLIQLAIQHRNNAFISFIYKNFPDVHIPTALDH